MNINSIILANSKYSQDTNLNNEVYVWENQISPTEKLLDKVLGTYSIGVKNILVSKIEIPNTNERAEGISVSEKTLGALCTLALTVDQLEWNLPVLVAPIDGLIPKLKILDFIEAAISGDYSASIVCFESTNPKFSYVRTQNNQVTEIAEKHVISNQATAGIFYFKNVETMLSCVEWSLLNNVKNNGKFYIAPSLNKLITENQKIGIFNISSNDYYRFTSPEEASESIERIQQNENI